MKRNQRRWATSLALASTIFAHGAIAGCDGSSWISASYGEEGTVHGKVTLDGSPVTKGKVVFGPAQSRRKKDSDRSAPIGADGTYSIKTLAGPNSVMVSPDRGEPNHRTPPTVPHRVFTLDVQPVDNNNFDIQLKTIAPPPAAR